MNMKARILTKGDRLCAIIFNQAPTPKQRDLIHILCPKGWHQATFAKAFNANYFFATSEFTNSNTDTHQGNYRSHGFTMHTVRL